MIIFQARSVLLTALIVWVVWRAVMWRRRKEPNAHRELAVWATFLWLLVIVGVTFFPMTIIFYDWHGASNLKPFASILELIRETPPEFAFENIVGNVLLFVPLGVLLPVLFDELKRPVALLWRAAVISLLIEGTQFLTRARSVDVDDVILNVTGAMIGLGIFTIAARFVARRESGRRLLGQLARGTGREPLLTGLVPLLVTLAIVLPMMASTIISHTVSGDAHGVEALATAGLPNGRIVARADVANHVFLLAAGDARPRQQLTRSDFEKVLPGRFVLLGSDTGHVSPSSTYQYVITSFNPTSGEQPILVLWGTNADNAVTVRVTGNGIDTVLPLDPGIAFVTGVEFEYDATAGILDEFEFTFVASDETPLTDFRLLGG